ncbi:MAG: ArsC/Spx/MgsR family protein [Pseudomonadota bacterium]
MILYGLKTCDTCRKALKSLDNAEFQDVRADGIPDDVLAAALKHFGMDLLNTRSTTWRGLSEAERDTAPMDLLKAHPALMKRPLIVKDGQMYLGWKKDVQDQLLG